MATLKELLEEIWRDNRLRQANRFTTWTRGQRDDLGAYLEGEVDEKYFVYSGPGRLVDTRRNHHKR